MLLESISDLRLRFNSVLTAAVIAPGVNGPTVPGVIGCGVALSGR